MLINFCDGRLQPKISCDSVSRDEHPPENLVSADPGKRRRGFIAEYFIKPPVTLTIHLPCNIEIFKLFIDPVVGMQKSCAFEVYTLSDKVNDINTLEKMLVTGKESMENSRQLFHPVGRINMENPGLVCFHNRSYILNPADNFPNFPAYSHLHDLRHHKASSLNFVSTVKIRITRTYAGKSVAVKSIDIWGRPSRHAASSLVKKIYRALKATPIHINSNCQTLGILESTQKPKPPSVHAESVKKLEDKFVENGIEIPDEFIDPLTCEMMTLPMLLPSGKNVDQLTLEKHIDSEASRGRLPSDPFTGVAFDERLKPLPNAPLKTRLDRFMLINSERLKHLPKTLGRKDDVYNEQQPSVSCVLGLTLQPYTKSVNEGTTSRLLNTECERLSRGPKKRHLEDFTDLECAQPKRPASTAASTVNKSLKHEDKLQSSLDDALQNTLGFLPSFLNRSICDSERKHIDGQSDINTGTMNHCVTCQSCDTLYKVPCGHLFCRKCLTSSSTMSGNSTVEDKICKRGWKMSDFVRVHR